MKITRLMTDLLDFSWDVRAADPPPRAAGSARLSFSRRSFLQAAVASAPIFSDHGRIKPPVPVPDVRLVSHDGASATLGNMVAGHATAVQLMFTECSTTCPIQAAIFHRVQRLVPDMAGRGIQLLSLSVDPAADTPKALSAWLKHYDAGPSWIAAAPSTQDGPLLQSFFGRASVGYADHSTQVTIVDRHCRLVWRTNELPAAEEIAGVLQRV